MSAVLDLRLLRTLVEVQRAGSITGAAALLGLSQPAVTGQVRALEQSLGRTLFVRQARGVIATPLAEMLADSAAPHIDALQQLVAAGLHGQDPIAERTINIGGPAELTTARVVPALTPLIAQGLLVRATLGLADDLLAALAAGVLDIVVSTVRVRRRGLDAVPLCDEELVLIASPPRARSLSSLLEAEAGRHAPLSGEPLIAYAEDMPLLRRYWSVVFDARPVRRPAVVIPDLRGILAAVAADAGISVLPYYLCQSAIDRGEVLPVLEPEVTPLNVIFLAVRAGSLAKPHIAAVHSHLIREGRLWGSRSGTLGDLDP
jgi:DNA-binding transcriptional LysR family regulator